MTITLARTSPRSAQLRRSPSGTASSGAFASRPSRGLVARMPAGAAKRPAAPACAALAALQSPVPNTTPNFLTSLLLAVVSLGALPALFWPIRFRRAVEAETRALLELAEWGKSRLNDADGRDLMETARRVGFAPSLMTLGMVGVVTALGAVAWGITQISPPHDLFSWLLGLTYGAMWPRFSAVTTDAPLGVFAIWTAGLTIAYSAHLVQVHLYAHGVRRFLDEFNKLSIHEGYSPVLLDPIGFGLSPWLLTAMAVLALSGGWAIPFSYAGATDCRLRRRALPRMRKGVVGRVRDIIFARTPAQDPPPIPAVTRCTTSGCGRLVGKGVKFCPRCGAKAGPSVDRWI